MVEKQQLLHIMNMYTHLFPQLSRMQGTCAVLYCRKTQHKGPVYLSLSGCSPLTYPARVALPVATLPPAYLSGSLHRTSLLTGKRCFRHVRGTSRIQLTWYSHVQRNAEGRLLRIALKWMPKQQRA